MKKLILPLLLIALCTIAFASCDPESDGESENTTESEATTSPEDTTVQSEETTEFSIQLPEDVF